MRLAPTCAIGGLLLLLWSSDTPAQELRAPVMEIGGQLTALGAIGEGLHMRPLLGPRLIINLTQRNAVELSGDVMGPSGRRQLDGLYFVLYKRLLSRRSEWNPNTLFFTIGSGGYFFSSSVEERRQPRLDGSIVVFPARTHSTLSPLRNASVNFGLEHRLNDRVAARVEAGGLAVLDQDGYIGFRLIGGVSIPIGGYHAREN